jgi:hypothetical protein
MRDVVGALPVDQRRGDCSQCGWNCAIPIEGCPPPVGTGTCSFTWDTLTTKIVGQPASLGPAKTNYAYTALQGALAQSVIHYRRGRDSWTIPEATP